MRKRTIKFLIDNLYWAIVFVLPVVLYAIYAVSATHQTGTILQFSDIMSSIGLYEGNVIQTALEDLFATDGILPLFNSGSTIIYFLTYFVLAEIVHLAVDFLLFVPRLCHKYLAVMTQNNDQGVI